MKIIVTLVLFISSLAATAILYFGNFYAPDQRPPAYGAENPADLQKVFDKNALLMKGIVKRGETEKMALFEQNMADVFHALELAKERGANTAELERNIAQYAQTVMLVSQAMKRSAPHLAGESEKIKEGLEDFNKRIGRIGLYELKAAWMDLSRMKNDFVREPSKEGRLAFEEQWMHTRVLIGELYLDEPMEEPLFAYLDTYKNYVDTVASVYEQVGMQRVASIKGLSYTIKSQIGMMPFPSRG